MTNPNPVIEGSPVAAPVAGQRWNPQRGDRDTSAQPPGRCSPPAPRSCPRCLDKDLGVIALKPSPLAGVLALVALALIAPSLQTRQSFTGPAQQHDLRYIVQKLQPHLAVSGSAEVAAFNAFAARTIAKAAKPLPQWRMLLLADQLLNYFHDPHTVVYTPQSGLTMLPLGLRWVQGGVAAFPIEGTPSAVRVGDSVVSIGGRTPTQLEQALRRFFSGNSYWLRYFAGQQLGYGYLLHWLGAVDASNRVAVVLRRPGGGILRLSLPLQPVTQQSGAIAAFATYDFIQRYRAPFGLAYPVGTDWNYRVTPKYAVFWLTACVDSAAYNAAVQRFFVQVAQDHTPVVVLDLQENGGGYSSVAFAWLHHLPHAAAIDETLGDFASSPVQAPMFHGKIYVLQSWSTFSAAVELDDILSGFATSVGQPTGWSTGGWAAVKQYTTPLLGISFQVATQFYGNSFGSGKLPYTLHPQIPLALTLKDVVTGKNPVSAWLQSVIASSGR